MKLNKKGFTIVELVIVIAVIAILAAVLIPTFSNVIKKANDSAALQAVRNAYTEALSKATDNGNYKAGGSESSNGFTFTWAKDATTGDLTPSVTTAPDKYKDDYTFSWADNAWKVADKGAAKEEKDS